MYMKQNSEQVQWRYLLTKAGKVTGKLIFIIGKS